MQAIQEKQLKPVEKRRAAKRRIVEPLTDSDEDISVCQQANRTLFEIQSLRKEVQSVLKLTRNTKVPAGLKSILQQTFECSICLVTVAPIVPPVIATKCCKNILGCQTCSDRWYAGEVSRRKPCPLCKHERGFAKTN